MELIVCGVRRNISVSLADEILRQLPEFGESRNRREIHTSLVSGNRAAAIAGPIVLDKRSIQELFIGAICNAIPGTVLTTSRQSTVCSRKDVMACRAGLIGWITAREVVVVRADAYTGYGNRENSRHADRSVVDRMSPFNEYSNNLLRFKVDVNVFRKLTSRFSRVRWLMQMTQLIYLSLTQPE